MLEMTVRSIARSIFIEWTVYSFKVTSRRQHNYFIVFYTFGHSFFEMVSYKVILEHWLLNKTNLCKLALYIKHYSSLHLINGHV